MFTPTPTILDRGTTSVEDRLENIECQLEQIIHSLDDRLTRSEQNMDVMVTCYRQMNQEIQKIRKLVENGWRKNGQPPGL